MTTRSEWRVRAVTRYIVTKFVQSDGESGCSNTFGEFDDLCTASNVARALAEEERRIVPNWDVQCPPFEGPPPGKVMRCKVTLNGRSHCYAPAPLDENNRPPGRYTEIPWSYINSAGGTVSGISATPDATDTANIVLDGESLMFGAVCPPTCDPNGAEENLIFGKFTPNARFEMHVRNDEVLSKMELGRSYYVDFTPAPNSI